MNPSVVKSISANLLAWPHTSCWQASTALAVAGSGVGSTTFRNNSLDQQSSAWDHAVFCKGLIIALWEEAQTHT